MRFYPPIVLLFRRKPTWNLRSFESKLHNKPPPPKFTILSKINTLLYYLHLCSVVSGIIDGRFRFRFRTLSVFGFSRSSRVKGVILQAPCKAFFTLAAFTLVPDLSFEYWPSLAFAKNTTVLQSSGITDRLLISLTEVHLPTLHGVHFYIEANKLRYKNNTFNKLLLSICFSSISRSICVRIFERIASLSDLFALERKLINTYYRILGSTSFQLLSAWEFLSLRMISVD